MRETYLRVKSFLFILLLIFVCLHSFKRWWVSIAWLKIIDVFLFNSKTSIDLRRIKMKNDTSKKKTNDDNRYSWIWIPINNTLTTSQPSVWLEIKQRERQRQRQRRNVMTPGNSLVRKWSYSSSISNTHTVSNSKIKWRRWWQANFCHVHSFLYRFPIVFFLTFMTNRKRNKHHYCKATNSFEEKKKKRKNSIFFYLILDEKETNN